MDVAEHRAGAALEAELAKAGRDEWIERCLEAGIPVRPSARL